MADEWDLGVWLPRAGLRFSVAERRAIAEPMGECGVRIKWPAPTRREVRVSVEDDVHESSLGRMLATGAAFGMDIVARGEFDDGKGELSVHRLADLRHHVLVATRRIRRNQIVQLSMEAGADGVEVADEWSMLESVYEAVEGASPQPDGPVVVISPFSVEHRIRFDLPGDTFVAQWAYGMAQLRRRRARDPGRMSFGALSAEDVDDCRAAFEAVAVDAALTDAEAWVDDDTAVLSAGLTDDRGVKASLLAGARPLGRGVAIVVATLMLEGEDESAIEDILSHAAATAATFGRARKPRATPDAVTVLEKMDSFRHRVAV
jgi:hypothetical protein